MQSTKELNEEEVTRNLTYAGFILLAFELVKDMVVNPIKLFYRDMTFGEGMPFKSYEADVLSRHSNVFEACLLYLRDFMEVLDSEDVLTIQSLRKHRNDLAHDLPNMLNNLNIAQQIPLLEKTEKALFKLSNHRMYMEIGHDPEFQDKGINWETAKGPEYVLFEEVMGKIKIMQRWKN